VTSFETLMYIVLCMMEANMIVLSCVVFRIERKINEIKEGR
jgi:hypothetical protein